MDEQQQNLGTIDQIQQGNVGQLLPYHTHNGIDSPVITVSEASLLLADITTGNATTERHGLLPKLSGDATEFLDGTGDYDTVKDSDLSTSDITTNNVTSSKHGFVPKAPNDTTKFLRGDGNWDAPVVSVINITVTAGEVLEIGDVVRLQVGTGNSATQGYQWVNGTLYACRAAADDTTYGETVIGVMTSAASYLGTGTCAIAGNIPGLSALTANAKQYLDDYSAASSQTITQATWDTEQALSAGSAVFQLWVPTSSLLDKATFMGRKNGGGGDDCHVVVKRVNTTLGTASATLASSGGAPSEFTVTFSPAIQTYKGEILKFEFTDDTGFGFIAYQATGDAYAGQYQGSAAGNDAGGGSIPGSGADMYMKIFEYTNFGKLATAAGTRKIKIGHSFSTTELLFALQYADSIL
jgi:hypothetical protein